MKFSKNLYFDEECKKKKRKIKHRLRWKKPLNNIYLIVLSEHPDHQLEIFNSLHTLQPVFTDEYFVVGIVKGYENALEFVEQTVNYVYNVTGGADIRSYIFEKEQELQ